MKARDAELLSAGEWAGEFYPPGEPDKRFTGTVSYSPERGVRLAYLVTAPAPEFDGDVLHGTLVTGEPVTLFGAAGWFPGQVATGAYSAAYTGEASFYALCVGEHLSPAARITSLDFSLPGLDAFIAPEVQLQTTPWSPNPLVVATVPDGEVHIAPAGTFDFIADIRGTLTSFSKHANEALYEAYQSVRRAYPEALFFMRRSLTHRLELLYTEAVPLKEGIRRCKDLCGLFAMLFRLPVHPARIRANFHVEGALMTWVTVLPTFLLHTETVAAARAARPHHEMPITLSAVDLSVVIPRWLAEPQIHAGLVADLQSRTGLYTGQGLRGMVLLYATQFEAIAKLDGKKHDGRVEYALGTYASVYTAMRIGEYLGGETYADLAKAVSTLRNEIAHIDKPQKILPSLGEGLAVVAMCMELVVIGFILQRIGIAKDVVERYQDRFAQEF